MYTGVTEEFVNAITKTSRKFHARIIIGEEEYTVIKSLECNYGSCAGDNITFGTTVSSYINVSMEPVNRVIAGAHIRLQEGLNVKSGIEWINMGVFTAQKPEEENGTLKFTAYDRMSDTDMLYSSDLTYPSDTYSVISEISEICEFPVSADTTELLKNNPVTVQNKLEGYTCREIIGYVAGLYGKFALFDRNGELNLKWYEDSEYEIGLSRTFGIKTGESDFTVDYIKCNKDNETQLSAGGGLLGITFDNPWMSQDILDRLFEHVIGFRYRPVDINFLGDIRLDAWDIINVYDLHGEKLKVPVMQLIQKFDGGVVTNVKAVGKTAESSKSDFAGPTSKRMERFYAELVLINEAMVNKLTVDEADIRYLQADKIDVIEADITDAVIKNLDTEFLTVENADLKYATIKSLDAEKARIDNLKVGIADINTLIFGSATGSVIQTEFANSVIAQLGNAQIKSAMIEEITADKITGLDINTTKFTVHSQDGKSTWADNTIQISDSVRTRVQIGKDAAGDYNMYVWDKSGNLMFDALGLTDSGIQREIIRNDMVSENADISAAKINIESLFDVINNDGSHTLKSSKIFVDAEKQTLDIAFKNMTTSVTTVAGVANAANSTANKADEHAKDALNKANANAANIETVTEKVTTQGTQLSTVQGQISSKIWQQDITTTVNKIKVGGRNLYAKTSETEKVCPIPTDAAKDYLSSFTTVPVVGETYILSFWARADVEGAELWTYFHNPNTTTNGQSSQGSISGYVDGACLFTLSTQWKKYWVIYTQSKTTSAKHIIFRVKVQSKKGNIYIKSVKFEEGNKATDWTPAPEDIENEITALSTKYTDVKQTVDGISTTVGNHTSQISSLGTKAEASETNYKQLSDKFSWVVKSGTSETNFTLTERVAELLSEEFNINALTTFKNSAQNGASTVINGGAIKTNTITADKINVQDLFSKNLTITGKFTTTSSAFITPTQNAFEKIRSYVLGEGKLSNQEIKLFDYNCDGKVTSVDLTYAKRLMTRVWDTDDLKSLGYEIPYNQITAVIEPNNSDKVIKISGTSSWGEFLQTYIGINGIITTGMIECGNIQTSSGADLNNITGYLESDGWMIFKFADGTLMCAKSVLFEKPKFNTRWGESLYETESLNLGNFPVNFVSKPHVQVTVNDGSALLECCYEVTTFSAGKVWLARPDQHSENNYTVNVFAVGRWKK